MPATGIHHTKISVSDMDRSLHFYRDVLGFELIYDAFRDDPPAYRAIMGFEKVQVRIAMLRDPNQTAVIGLLQFTEPAPVGTPPRVNHVGFATLAVEVDDIDADYRRFQQEQIRTMLAGNLRGVIAQTLLKRKGKGRVAAFEVLVVTHGVGNNIRERKVHQIASLLQTGAKLGMVCLNDSLLRLVLDGVVEPKEALNKAIDRDGLFEKLRVAGVVE